MKNPDKIESLIKKCKQQDKHAQMEIYRLYYQAMFNISYRIVKRFEDAEDVMQEAFIKAFQKIEHYKGQATFGAWLKRIVINESLNWIKKNASYPYGNETIVEPPDEEEEDCELSHLKARQILEAMDMLKERYRIILSLHIIEGYDYEEIQEITGLSYGNLRTLISRAKSQLKKILQEEYGITK